VVISGATVGEGVSVGVAGAVGLEGSSAPRAHEAAISATAMSPTIFAIPGRIRPLIVVSPLVRMLRPP
jgi:hypothetical protein